MNYSFLLGRAWEIVRRHRFIWWLGLLAMFTGGGGGGFHGGGSPGNFPSQTGPQHHKSLSDWSRSTQALPLLPRLLPGGLPRVQMDIVGGLRMELERWFRQAWPRVQPLVPLIILGVLLLFLLGLVLLYFSFAAQAGLILSVQALEEQQIALGFARAMGAGRAFVWRLFGMDLLLGFGMLILLMVLAAPVVALALLGRKLTVAIIGAVLIGIMVVLLFIVVAVYVSLLALFAARRMVLSDEGIMDGLAGAHKQVLGRLGTALVAWLVGFVVSLGYSVVIVLALLLVAGILAGIGYGVYLLAHWVGVILYAVPVGAALLVILFIVGGVFTGFLSSYWTLVYREFLDLAAAPARPGPWDRPVQFGRRGNPIWVTSTPFWGIHTLSTPAPS
jgi:hypothetical protein